MLGDSTHRVLVDPHNIDQVFVVVHSLTSQMGQPMYKVELVYPFFIKSKEHLSNLVEMSKQQRAHEKMNPFAFALTGFYRRLLDQFRTDEDIEDISPIYQGEVPKSERINTDTVMTPSQKSKGSKVNLSHSPSKVFDTNPASSPRIVAANNTSPMGKLSHTESDDLEESNIYVPDVESPSKRRRIYSNDSPSAKKPSSPNYNKQMPQVKPFEETTGFKRSQETMRSGVK